MKTENVRTQNKTRWHLFNYLFQYYTCRSVNLVYGLTDLRIVLVALKRVDDRITVTYHRHR